MELLTIEFWWGVGIAAPIGFYIGVQFIKAMTEWEWAEFFRNRRKQIKRGQGRRGRW